MMNYNNIKHICFDLDGTLVNSSKTIFLATETALKKFNVDMILQEKEFSGMIGKHFIDIFSELKIEIPDFMEFITHYKSVYFDFINTSTLYDGVIDLLDSVRKKGLMISLLTTKSQDQAEKIIQHFELNKKMDYIMGRRDGMAHKPSPEPLLKICNDLGAAPSETIIVGDTELDIQCGKNANAITCGVLYGYRTRSQIENEKPDLIINNLRELSIHFIESR